MADTVKSWTLFRWRVLDGLVYQVEPGHSEGYNMWIGSNVCHDVRPETLAVPSRRKEIAIWP